MAINNYSDVLIEMMFQDICELKKIHNQMTHLNFDSHLDELCSTWKMKLEKVVRRKEDGKGK